LSQRASPADDAGENLGAGAGVNECAVVGNTRRVISRTPQARGPDFQGACGNGGLPTKIYGAIQLECSNPLFDQGDVSFTCNSGIVSKKFGNYSGSPPHKHFSLKKTQIFD
jgi:hypothetical protein